jgi:Arc/MetJ-type ribon-helix-helix transcriptional regulator
LVRKSTSITLPEECLKWIDEQVEARIYYTRSHAIECAILKAMKKQRDGADE